MKKLLLVAIICLLAACGVDQEYNPVVTPLAQTVIPRNVTSTKAILLGNSLNGGAQISERGFYYITNMDNAITQDTPIRELLPVMKEKGQQVDVPVSGEFEGKVEGLTRHTTYAAMAYVVTSAGTSYSNACVFTTPGEIPPTVSINKEYVKEEGSTNIVLTASMDAPGGDDVSEMGFVWSNTTIEPTLEDGTAITVDPVIGIFTTQLTDLVLLRKYYIRAYAKNAYGTSYSESLMALFMGDQFIDSRDGQSYPVKQYGNSVWMTENFRHLPEDKFQKGAWVQPQNYTSVSEAKASESYLVYGCLYDLETALALAPEGWHVATDAEWIELEIISGISQEDAWKENDWRGNTNDKLKASTWEGLGAWNNSMQFNLHPGGKNWFGAAFQDYKSLGFYWTSTINEGRPDGQLNPFYRFFSSGPGTGRFSDFPSQVALSVRYVMD